jgi:hypothetical protein
VSDVKKGGFSEWGLPALRVAAVAGTRFLRLVRCGTLGPVDRDGPLRVDR